MAAVGADTALRSARLRKFLYGITDGNRAIKNGNDAQQFLQALCNQQDRPATIEKLVASKNGLQALKMSLRCDISSTFINQFSADFLAYLDHDGVKQLCGGQILKEVFQAMTEPPTFWNGLVQAFQQSALTDQSLRILAAFVLDLLVILPLGERSVILEFVQEALKPGGGFLDSTDSQIRSISYKLQDIFRTQASGNISKGHIKPGGRHDNDFEDFRQIEIFPTADEFLAKDKPFYLQADSIAMMDVEVRSASHLDNQFRLLREDMLAELRDDFQTSQGKKRGRRVTMLSGLLLRGVSCGPSSRRKPAMVEVICHAGLPNLRNYSKAYRQKWFKDNPTVLKHNSFGCLLASNEIVAFATVDRNEELLAQDPPVILLQILGNAALLKALLCFKTMDPDNLRFFLVDTPFFAYEPVLRALQSKSSLPLAKELLNLDGQNSVSESPFKPSALVEMIEANEGRNLRDVLKLPKDVVLDRSQTSSLIAGLSQAVSLIQGPPGTGKSFIGAILAKSLAESTREPILVLCFTNHALDQFLEDIMDIGVDQGCMLRLGSKSTLRTKPLGLFEQSINFRRTKASWNVLNMYSNRTDERAQEIDNRSNSFQNLRASASNILEYLQFAEKDSEYFYAFSIPEDDDGMTRVDKKGKGITTTYLIEQWSNGLDAGIFKNQVQPEHYGIWKMEPKARHETMRRWHQNFFQEHAVLLQDEIRDYSSNYNDLSTAREEKNATIIRNKRIIGCTTTAAAKYTKELSAIKPGIVIVEEAGEILESHVLTALSSDTKHLVLIGDHKQLRPKTSSYALTVEKGDGYNLNVSLFERLATTGYPHTTLAKQHRMRPEISAFVRNLTYPDLQDAEKTYEHPNIRGLQSNVVFLDHSHPEASMEQLSDRRDENSKVSRQNRYEADMILRIVRYLAQQGYGTDQQVVLTPYLGQLKLLCDIIRTEHDPVLEDMDSFDLVKAGLLPQSSANASKRPLRISTIDNYQGEESDIVIASLTRSNNNGDIGFMAAPQRLNVLLSRARNGLIIVGNSKTYVASRKGKDVWAPFVEQLSKNGQIFDGLPIKCERHPDKATLIKSKSDFDKECPDGGCTEPCGVMLQCGKHQCPSKCHQIFDHSKMQCETMVQVTCTENHQTKLACWKSTTPCRKCEAEKEKQEAIRQRDVKLDKDRQAKQDAYARQLQQLDDEIAHERRLQKEYKEKLSWEAVVAQRKKDLANAKATTTNLVNGTKNPAIPEPNNNDSAGSSAPSTGSRSPNTPNSYGSPPDNSPITSSSPVQPIKPVNNTINPLPPSQAKLDWEYQKQYEMADNVHLDTLMDMIGLESVKQQILDVKTKIDTCIRQGASLEKERFGVSLLGNPGTGKTTVARLYAMFLASVGIVPGTAIEETTGSSMASNGVKACEELIKNVLSRGGGAIFIDEAYQLASDNSPDGKAVLDYLLAEIENLTGKVVFILAGYNKQMEKFFAHNPGIPSRFPYQFQFNDYEDEELRMIFEYQVKKRYGGRMKIEDGFAGLYCRIVARRIGYGRDRDGFGNARAVENVLAKVSTRQAVRLKQQRRSGKGPDDLLFNKHDLIGPEPKAALTNNKSWNKLLGLTGLGEVKTSIKALLDTIQYNYERELEETPLVQFNLNKVFLGSPGTGKTTVAKLYGQLLADLGFLSTSEVVVKNPADFISDVIGGSEKTTQGILSATEGKVLVIDEAYGLYGGSSDDAGSGSQPNQFKTAIIDTIVAVVQSVPGDDRCVLLLGYKDLMEAMFQNVNPGLSRRFPLSEAFEFEDFTDDELKVILDMKLGDQGYDATDQAKHVALDVLRRARNRPNFGNAGEIDILLNSAKGNHQKRRSKGAVKGKSMLEAIDMDPNFDRGQRAVTNVQRLFEGVIGCEELVSQLENYQRLVANMKARDMDPRTQIPFNFLFKGPPGTGKTTTARKMGKIYYDMGFLASAEVIEVSATDMVGQYVGQTGPKTKKLLDKALGRILFIDEAYRLAEGHFAQEALDELVDLLTKPSHQNKLIVILAGYDHDVNRLMTLNPGLTSRFPETVSFQSLKPDKCLELFAALLKKKKRHLDIGVLEPPSELFRHDLLERFQLLLDLAGWANGRDIETLAKETFNHVLVSWDPALKGLMYLAEKNVVAVFDEMIMERLNRATAIGRSRDKAHKTPPVQTANPLSQESRPTNTNTNTGTKENPRVLNPQQNSVKDALVEPQPEVADFRDAGVSDEVWLDLELDKKAAANRERKYQELLKEEARLKDEYLQKEKKEEEIQKEKSDQISSAPPSDQDDIRRLHEEERIQRELERWKVEQELEKIEKERIAKETEKKKEEQAQKKLRSMGVCVAGYRWIKIDGGYRCAGGSHFVSNAQLE